MCLLVVFQLETVMKKIGTPVSPVLTQWVSLDLETLHFKYCTMFKGNNKYFSLKFNDTLYYAFAWSEMFLAKLIC